MVKHFGNCVLESGLKIPDMLQISMDGPNVNWKFFEIMKQKLVDDYGTQLLNIGSCGLHIVHNSFKCGADASKWQVASYLSSLYYLFKDSPARREDYVTLTGSSKMPLKFCSHRWLENVPVCERAVELFNNIDKYVKSVNEKKIPNPGNKSYEVISSCMKDKLFTAKLNFFMSVALQLRPFLALYQTDRPMLPFIGDDLCSLIRSLLIRFMNSETISNMSDEQLVKIKIDSKEDKEMYVHVSKIDVGFACDNILKKKGLGVSEKQILEFRLSCRDFLIATVKKLLLKSPVIYSLVRKLSCLNPVRMANEKEECKTLFKKVLSLMMNAKKVGESECDALYRSFVVFIDKIKDEKFTNFRKSEDSLDSLYYDTMIVTKVDDYVPLFNFIKLFLVMSHGQASVERGFSINKEVEVENLKAHSLIAQRVIIDHVKYVGGIKNVLLTKDLLLSCKMARQKYEVYLEKERQKRKSEVERNKRKAQIDVIDEIKIKKRRLESDINGLTKAADDLYVKAEQTGKIMFVTQGNSFKRSVKEKEGQLKEINDKLQQEVELLKKM